MVFAKTTLRYRIVIAACLIGAAIAVPIDECTADIRPYAADDSHDCMLESSAAYGYCECCHAGQEMYDGYYNYCYDCPKGYFSPTAGAFSGILVYGDSRLCILCPVGKFQDQVRGSNCTTCPPGSITNTGPSHGATSCSKCTEGSYSESSAVSECTLCPVKSVANTGRVAGATSCVTCPPGSITNTGAVRGGSTCTACTSGKYSTRSDVAACTNCAAGKYNSITGSGNEAGCEECGQGSMTDTGAAVGASNCTACTPGYFSAASIHACSACDSGRYSLDKAAACTKCEAGKYKGSTGAGGCDGTLCAQGQYGPTGQTDSDDAVCSECPVGKYQEGQGASSCAQCPKGRYQSEAAQSNCHPCSSASCATGEVPEGCELEGSTRDIICIGGCAIGYERRDLEGTEYFCKNYSTTCSSCGCGGDSCDGKEVKVCTSGELKNRTACDSCTPGFFGNATNAPQCFPCPQGRYSSGYSSSECATCIAGRYGSNETLSTARSSLLHCELCPGGQYQAEAGQTECTYCPAGYFGTGGSTTAACDGSCMVGTYATGGAESCISCVAGTYGKKETPSTSTSEAHCVACEAGR
jgi:hypothetical protein